MDEVLDKQILAAVRRFVERDVMPVASELEHRDEYPQALVDKMKGLGLFGAPPSPPPMAASAFPSAPMRGSWRSCRADG